MPYISQSSRQEIDGLLDRTTSIEDIGASAGTVGELNYILTSIILGYFNSNFKNYAAINDVLGALEGAKLEFYRRAAALYEDKKIAENGDVYPNDRNPDPNHSRG